MENNHSIIIFETDYSQAVKNFAFKMGIFFGALIIGSIIESNPKNCLNFYGIMSERLKRAAP